MNYLLKNWFDLQKNISNQSELVSPYMLCETLIAWSRSLQISKDKHIKELYNLYLSNYANLDLSKYPISHLGNAFKDFLNYDYINQKPKDIERAIVLTRDILWNLIVVKSEKECPNCGRDKLRVLTDESENRLYLSCDECAYTENLKSERIDIDIRLQPASSKLLLSNYPFPADGYN